MKTQVFLALLAPAFLVSAAALADEKAACLDAASKGQRFRDHHKLVEAREQLRICAAAVCPAVVQSDCATWLADVDAALPSVVVTAKNGAGADLVDVNVTLDGQPFAANLDGHAVSVNAGPHAFHFVASDGSTLDKQVMIREGEKNQAVAVVLGAVPVSRPPAAGGASTPEGAGGEPGHEALPTAEPSHGSGSSGTLKTLGWVLAGMGVAGLGVGATFGVIALGDMSKAHCVKDVCDAGTTVAIKSSAFVSDVGWIAGGVLFAGGASLVLFAPSGGPASGLRVSPIVTARGAGIVTEGAW